MGEAELIQPQHLLIIHSELVFYGDAANDALSWQIAKDVAGHWNEVNAKLQIKNTWYDIRFYIKGRWDKLLTPLVVYENTDPRINYFRVEEYVTGDISFVDAINSNTGYFKLDNLLNSSTTAAHEYGHTLGLEHPRVLDIRGEGTPGIMYPRGTLVDPSFQYSPDVPAGQKGGTLNPFTRKVLEQDIANLHLHRLDFNEKGLAIVGDFTSIWHEKHEPLEG